jgi:3-hydroxyisobutyrate dehydrogenase-like beta-hydroxyacid dehydrogenase
MYALKGPKMLRKDHAPNFPIQHAHKDMKLAVDMANGAGVAYAVTECAERLFRKARADAELNIAVQDCAQCSRAFTMDQRASIQRRGLNKTNEIGPSLG